ncbi:hypothetical protein [Amphritea japonica]|uniref:YtkA-like domain-containing protein n=1 Tax=Amphritea japonica ATCC BAA-1530 TaxID=1278309 RepID=A0A7R6P4C6_9GAMM|nr:hypothetical protein [Amphritea japonica]BBB25734.1 conserved hypothetical protein [Amphritea japonica ATCC BAA-1530]
MTQAETKKKSTTQYLYLLLLGGFILAIWLGTSLFALPKTDQPGVTSNCDLRQQSCTVSHGEVTITLDIQPRDIRSLTPLSYLVNIEGTNASQVMIDLQGSEMFMGINQTALSPVAEKPGMFTGQGELAVCTTGEMGWRLTVSAETAAGRLDTRFNFRAK